MPVHIPQALLLCMLPRTSNCQYPGLFVPRLLHSLAGCSREYTLLGSRLNQWLISNQYPSRLVPGGVTLKCVFYTPPPQDPIQLPTAVVGSLKHPSFPYLTGPFLYYFPHFQINHLHLKNWTQIKTHGQGAGRRGNSFIKHNIKELSTNHLYICIYDK